MSTHKHSKLPQSVEYLAILRCQTWNAWPEKTRIEHRRFQIEYGGSKPIPARLMIISYLNRLAQERYVNEETNLGPLIWNGETRGLHRIRDMVLKAPEDVVELAWKYRQAQRGEVDISINFHFEGDLPVALLDALRTTALAIMSLINLWLKDYLTPAAPFQVREVLPDGGGKLGSSISVGVHTRHTVTVETLESTLLKIANVLSDSSYGHKLRVALELYAAHFNEPQVRVRFLLLVIAMESLAKPAMKTQAAIDLLDRWQRELTFEISKQRSDSEEFRDLEALSRELGFRAQDSIRSQVRKLFAKLNDLDATQSDELQRRALYVYDKRSTLVHDGYLPTEELSALETEARVLLEKLFTDDISQQTYNPSLA